MEEARAEANAIVKQHEDALRSVFEQHQIEARRQSETRVRAESVTAKQQLNMAMSKAQLELKREMGKTQTELKTELFEEVQLKLLTFMRTEEYKEVLIRYIEKAAQFASGMAMTIYINPSDADKKTYLEERTGMTLTISKVDFIGGVRAVVPEKNVLVDYAFKGALENEYQKFQQGLDQSLCHYPDRLIITIEVSDHTEQDRCHDCLQCKSFQICIAFLDNGCICRKESCEHIAF